MDSASIIHTLEFDASRHCPLVDNIPIPGMFVVLKTHPYMGHYSILLKEEGSLRILNENLSRLTDTAKHCLKALNSSSSTAGSKGMPDSSKKEEVELGFLRVVIYLLRSTLLSTLLNIGSSGSSSSQRHGQRLVVFVLTKLVYHCVVIAGEACHKEIQSVATAASHNAGTMSPATCCSATVATLTVEYAMLCLGAYKFLGRLLQMDTRKLPNARNGNASGATWDEMMLVLASVGGPEDPPAPKALHR